jgi:tetratricopeptide (TPR) repeat protein
MRLPRLSPHVPIVPTLSIAIALAVVIVDGPVRADEVVLVNGSPFKGAVGGRVRGQVQTETAAEVTVKLGASEIKVPTDQIASVHYDGQPATMTLAESRESGGQLAEAADLYKKAAGEASAKPLIANAAKFKQADVTADLALADPGRVAEAVSLLEGFIRSNPSSRQTGAALESLARLQLQSGDFAKVDKTIADLTKLPKGGDRAAVLSARLSARRGDHAKALEELDRLIKSAPEGSPLQRESRLARAESLAGLKKFKEAEAEARAVIKALPAEDVAAQSAAYNTLGDCLRIAGRPKDALLAYLHTDLLYAKDKEQHPRALAQISRLWRELKRDDRADEVWQRLKQDYPQSPYLTSRGTTP